MTAHRVKGIIVIVIVVVVVVMVMMMVVRWLQSVIVGRLYQVSNDIEKVEIILTKKVICRSLSSRYSIALPSNYIYIKY